MFGWVLEYSFTAMPSEPDSGPTMMSTLSCSTSFRVAFTATSGFASDDALMISIFLPATVPPRCLTASSAPRMPSWPPAANGPSSVASRPIFTVCCCAVAIPAATTASTTASAVHTIRFFGDVIVPSSCRAASQAAVVDLPLLRHAFAEPHLQIPTCVHPPAEQAVGREQHDDQEHGADQKVE